MTSLKRRKRFECLERFGFILQTVTVPRKQQLDEGLLDMIVMDAQLLLLIEIKASRKISARIKGKVYETVERAAMLYGLETVALRKRQESELEVAELKMLRFSLGVMRLDRIRNEYIRGTAHVGRLGDRVREARLRWFGHVQRRESEYIGRRMLDMELPGRRRRGRPKRRYMEVINEDMKLVGASVEDAEDRDRWRVMIRCGDP
ncbi:hypothetical protein PDJAM_G00120230 [Pangasius djambal]|uniref:Uncharacterized protein n=1 Tax=Pangasius djambal TaxID=1691987 RepID=A0ACC5Z943_9TELE|nr:hypothetical protein [Pangasius djambal]